MKKTWSILIAVLLGTSLLLSACGGGGSEPATSEPAGDKNETKAPAVPEPGDGGSQAAANDEAFTIRVGAWFIDQREFMKTFVADVEKAYKEKYPNATIQWDVLLDAGYFDKLKAELASDTAPDVFFQQGLTAQFAEAGYVLDLSGEAWADKINPGANKFVKYDGKVYAAPMGLGTSGVWYNKDMFKELGLTAPTTWTEFVEVSEAIKAAGKVPIGVGFKDLWTAQLFAGLMIQSHGFESSKTFGKELYDGAKKLDGPEIEAVMQKFQQLVDGGYFNKSALSIDWPQSAEMFTKGESAMIVQGPWMPGVASDNFNTKGHASFELGYMPLMTDSGYYNLAPSVDQNLSINAKTKLVQQAKDLVAIILSSEIYGPYNVGNGNIPAIDGIQVEYSNPVFNEVKEVLGAGESTGGFESYIPSSVYLGIAETVTKIVSGAKFSKDDLAELEKLKEKDHSTVILPSE
ncbi:ABC transporter substrate-binding protein [Paenibacillus sp.]|uniref:ABC transporter substrate-binding protein n=1 Tax=Paenibacillus sp. TaxID=58172 RepID=UPI002D4BD858|nr:extracellular solute-binding protein [Paenibacillus sp.]HZG56187.1 extracellular solute-binding protein [Paenibacillus sp.]